MPTLNAADFYQDEEYSDVTLKYSDRIFHAHKFIICRASEYFKKLCGPGSAFVEGQARVVELKDDDPDALDAVLRHMYTGVYHSTERISEPAKTNWKFHLDVSVTAGKYMMFQLRDTALAQCKSLLHQLIDPQGVFEALQKLPDYHGHDPWIDQFPAILHEKHLRTLLELPTFRTQLDAKKEDLWDIIDRLKFALSLERKLLVRCRSCDQASLRDDDNAPSYCSNYSCRNYNQQGLVITNCWIEKKS